MDGELFRKNEDVKGTVHITCYCLRRSLTRPIWGGDSINEEIWWTIAGHKMKTYR